MENNVSMSQSVCRHAACALKLRSRRCCMLGWADGVYGPNLA
jgi:hypothetical protein